jgi:hypothetical protein
MKTYRKMYFESVNIGNGCGIDVIYGTVVIYKLKFFVSACCAFTARLNNQITVIFLSENKDQFCNHVLYSTTISDSTTRSSNLINN